MFDAQDSAQLARATFDTTEALIRLIADLTKNMPKKSIEDVLMKKFVNGHGQVIGSNIPNYQADEVISNLQRLKIPYVTVPSGRDGVLILTREQYKSQLLAIEKAVSMRDVNVTKEISLSDLASSMRTEGSKETVELSFKDKDMAEIAKQKLFQSGCTFSSYANDNEEKLVVFPNSLFSEDGNDIEKFKLNYTLTQIRGDDFFKSGDESESELIKVRKEQSKYDKNMTIDFIQDAKLGKNVVLGDINGAGKIFVEAKDGELSIVKNGKVLPIYCDINDSVDNIYACISRYTENINNMMNIDGEFYHSNLQYDYLDKELLPDKYKNNPRPKVPQKYMVVHNFFNTTGHALINEVSKEASKRVMAHPAYKTLTASQKNELKHREIVNMLKDSQSPCMKILNEDILLNDKIKAKIHELLVKSFEDEHEENIYEVSVDKISFKDINNILDKNLDQIYENEKEIS